MVQLLWKARQFENTVSHQCPYASTFSGITCVCEQCHFPMRMSSFVEGPTSSCCTSCKSHQKRELGKLVYVHFVKAHKETRTKLLVCLTPNLCPCIFCTFTNGNLHFSLEPGRAIDGGALSQLSCSDIVSPCSHTRLPSVLFGDFLQPSFTSSCLGLFVAARVWQCC